MHELGIIIQVVKQVEAFAKENKITQIDKLILEVGELSSMYPKYIEDVYPIAVENSMLANTELVIEMLPGLVRCNACNFGYNPKINNDHCPLCKSDDFTVISGTEFNIKSIHAK